jgi:quercetin dioxygenase-like cupin family protein
VDINLPANTEDNRDGIVKLIEELSKLEQADMPVKHTFFNGQYIREMSAPAGTFIIGHFHKFKEINVCTKGKLALIKGPGEFEIVEAGALFIAEPGRKMAYVLEDMSWANIVVTDKTDIEEIENEFFDKSILNDIDPEILKSCKIGELSGEILLLGDKEA